MMAAALMEQELREADEADAIGITRTSSGYVQPSISSALAEDEYLSVARALASVADTSVPTMAYIPNTTVPRAMMPNDDFLGVAHALASPHLLLQDQPLVSSEAIQRTKGTHHG